jgi:hypothetical protein
MDDLRQGLEQIVNAIEEVANKPAPKQKFITNELSGDIIHGGTITNFNSTGIADQSTKRVMLVSDAGVTTDNLSVSNVKTEVTFEKNVVVDGLLTVGKLHVDELSADVRNERSSSLEFTDDNVVGKGLVWRVEDESSKQLTYKINPNRIHSTETFDLDKNAVYSIGNATVLTQTELGSSVRTSSLTRVGTLQDLHTHGNLTIDEFIFYDTDSQRLGIGTDAPNANLSITSYDTEFIVDVETNSTKLGNWTNNDLEIVTDDTARITIKSNGNVEVGSKGSSNARLNVFGKLGVGINNVPDDVDLSVSNSVEIAGHKIFYTDSMPSNGSYRQGDIAYNTNPQPTGYVGWVCTRDGTPGEWKTFGKIS